mmetsp:Transcript_44496/g.71519  ORF Transcript_44496/g.71519 Transcript_44496/m.71519 type:complete len:297 (-) Transcript_44496:232-1122(-)
MVSLIIMTVLLSFAVQPIPLQPKSMLRTSRRNLATKLFSSSLQVKQSNLNSFIPLKHSNRHQNVKKRDLGIGTHASNGRREILRIGSLLSVVGGVQLSLGRRPAYSKETEEPFYFDFDEGHLAALIPPGYTNVENEVGQSNELPTYLMTPDAVAQRELKKKSFQQLRNSKSNSSIIFTTTPCSSFKISFTRVNDISDYGTLTEVGKYVLPSVLKDLRMRERKEEFAERKTVRGVVKPPSRLYYRYDFTTQDGLDHIAINLAVVKGFVYTMTVTCPQAVWSDEEAELLASMETMTVA